MRRHRGNIYIIFMGGWAYNQLTGHSTYWRQFSGHIKKIKRGDFRDFSLPKKKLFIGKYSNQV